MFRHQSSTVFQKTFPPYAKDTSTSCIHPDSHHLFFFFNSFICLFIQLLSRETLLSARQCTGPRDERAWEARKEKEWEGKGKKRSFCRRGPCSWVEGERCYLNNHKNRAFANCDNCCTWAAQETMQHTAGSWSVWRNQGRLLFEELTEERGQVWRPEKRESGGKGHWKGGGNRITRGTSTL